MDPGKFYDLLISEVVENALSLDETSHETLRRYYRRLAGNPQNRPFYHYNWICRTAPMRKILQSHQDRHGPVRILDAGCGVGTESLSWATGPVASSVVAVDLSRPRLLAARARQRTYEQYLGRPLEVQFLEEDVFKILNRQRFQIIWTMEAISHIEPAEEFLRAAYEALLPGGVLVVSDSHLLNPGMAWRILQMRRRGVPQRGSLTLSTGETVAYAHERLFTARGLRDILLRDSFSPVEAQFSLFFPPRLFRTPAFRRPLRRFDAAMNRFPILRHLGGIYTLSARRPG